MPPKRELQAAAPAKANNLISAILLATVGGLLDAVVYLDHGHVFANAITGNVIFLGIAIFSGEFSQVIRFTLPIVAFVLGVLAALTLKSLPIRHGALLTLVVEATGLFVVGLLPGSFPQHIFVAIIAFVSAFQVTTFRRIGRFTYNSTFVTGNLRELVEGAYDSFAQPDAALRNLGRAKFSKLSLIVAAFLAGAVFGAWAARHHPTHAIWFAEPMLVAVMLLTLLQKPLP